MTLYERMFVQLDMLLPIVASAGIVLTPTIYLIRQRRLKIEQALYYTNQIDDEIQILQQLLKKERMKPKIFVIPVKKNQSEAHLLKTAIEKRNTELTAHIATYNAKEKARADSIQQQTNYIKNLIDEAQTVYQKIDLSEQQTKIKQYTKRQRKRQIKPSVILKGDKPNTPSITISHDKLLSLLPNVVNIPGDTQLHTYNPDTQTVNSIKTEQTTKIQKTTPKEKIIRVKELNNQLNQQLQPRPQKPPVLRYIAPKRNQYDNVDVEKVLMVTLSENLDAYQSVIEDSLSNQINYANYDQKVDALLIQKPKTKQELDFNKQIHKLKMTPPKPVAFKLIMTYRSEKGRVNLQKSANIDENVLIDVFSTIQSLGSKGKDQIKKLRAIKERDALGAGLRYNILERDEYRCQICGATASDGAALHVDHKIPVAQGGKSVPENLQTLCDFCNLGKRDKVSSSYVEQAQATPSMVYDVSDLTSS